MAQWPGMRDFVANYVKACPSCQQFKIDRNPAKPPLQPLPPSESMRVFGDIAMDLITDLPPCNGFDSILSVVDRGLSKGIILCPTTKTCTFTDISKLLIDNLYKRFGVPNSIVSDRDPRFASGAASRFYKMLKIEWKPSTAYHPQTDGATE